MAKGLTTSQFIERSNKIHNNKYDYTKSIYSTIFDKVIITCPIHGEFSQKPVYHINGSECPLCGIDKISEIRKTNKEEFIEKARVTHGDKFNYDKVVYVDANKKVIITCSIHGDFEQTPGSHIFGSGCSKCRSDNNKLSQEEFIEKAKAIHGNRYDYSKVKYINTYTKVIIVCSEHGEFYQIPNSHLCGNGCPRCNDSKGELAIKEILDKYNIEYQREYKIPGNSYKFRYDFYLPEHNVLIEFHGGQHYFPVKFFGGKEKLKIIQKRDMFKKELAKLANIPLIEFNYKHLDLNKDEFELIVLSIIDVMSGKKT